MGVKLVAIYHTCKILQQWMECEMQSWKVRFFFFFFSFLLFIYLFLIIKGSHVQANRRNCRSFSRCCKAVAEGVLSG